MLKAQRKRPRIKCFTNKKAQNISTESFHGAKKFYLNKVGSINILQFEWNKT